MRVLRVQALLEGSNSPTSRCPEAVDWILCVCEFTKRCEPLSQRREVAYIECARTPAPLRYTGFNVHKGGALLVTSSVKCYKCP